MKHNIQHQHHSWHRIWDKEYPVHSSLVPELEPDNSYFPTVFQRTVVLVPIVEFVLHPYLLIQKSVQRYEMFTKRANYQSKN